VWSVIDKAILAGLGIEVAAFVALLALVHWRKRFGKVAIIALGLAMVATLAPVAQRSDAHGCLHTVDAFARDYVEPTHAGAPGQPSEDSNVDG